MMADMFFLSSSSKCQIFFSHKLMLFSWQLIYGYISKSRCTSISTSPSPSRSKNTSRRTSPSTRTSTRTSTGTSHSLKLRACVYSFQMPTLIFGPVGFACATQGGVCNAQMAIFITNFWSSFFLFFSVFCFFVETTEAENLFPPIFWHKIYANKCW